jgi:GH25 family lysozyme M1 (1,4-beta-N-acetylmuramidase)
MRTHARHIARLTSAVALLFTASCASSTEPGEPEPTLIGDPAAAAAAKADAPTQPGATPVDSIKAVNITSGCGVSGVQGFDISTTNAVNWNNVDTRGYSFGYVSLGDGVPCSYNPNHPGCSAGYQFHTNPSFASHFHGIKSKGLLSGPYWFARPYNDVDAQADEMIGVLQRAGYGAGDLPPVLDIEQDDYYKNQSGLSAQDFVRYIDRWRQRMKDAFGKDIIIYTGKSWWDPEIAATKYGQGGVPLWVYHDSIYHDESSFCPDIPVGWGSYTFWQYHLSDYHHETLPGLGAEIDTNKFNGSLDDLRRLAGGGGGGNGGGGGSAPVGPLGNRFARNQDGSLVLFARGANNAIWASQENGSSGPWQGWFSLGGDVRSNPVASTNSDWRVEVFVTGGDGVVYRSVQSAPGAQSYSAFKGFQNPAGLTAVSEPAVGYNASTGTLEVFVRMSDGGIYHLAQDVAAYSWGDETLRPLAGSQPVFQGNPAVAPNADGRLEVFAIDQDGNLRHIFQTAPAGSWFDSWLSAGARFTGSPAVASNYSADSSKDGRLEVFVRGTDGGLYHAWQTAPNGSWSGTSRLGAVPAGGDPRVGRNGDGRLEVFIRGADAALWHVWQTAAGSGWTSGSAFSGTKVVGNPDIAADQNGLLDVYHLGTTGLLYETYQDPQHGGWSAFRGSDPYHFADF